MKLSKGTGKRSEEKKLLLKKLGKAVRDVRQSQCLSQAEVAKYCDVTAQEISNFERGLNDSCIVALRLIYLFDLSIDYTVQIIKLNNQ